MDAASVGLELIPSRGRDICRLGEMIKVATREQVWCAVAECGRLDLR